MKLQRVTMTGAQMILDERRRQIEEEGWASEHDDTHVNAEIAVAAECYVGTYVWNARGGQEQQQPPFWPWDAEWWKPSPNPIRNLVKAGALIAAEIDRLQRLGK